MEDFVNVIVALVWLACVYNLVRLPAHRSKTFMELRLEAQYLQEEEKGKGR